MRSPNASRSVLVVALASLMGCAPAAQPRAASEGATDPPEAVSPAPESASEAKTTRSEAPAAAAAAADDEAMVVPAACDGTDDGVCTPAASFAQALCKKKQPNVALGMFSKGTPWTRTYVRVRNMEAWLVGARRASPAKLKLFEEVIILTDRSGGDGGVKVSGSGSYDVVRWDGSCVSVMSDEVNTRRPGEVEVANIPWRRLKPSIRKVLKEDKRIAYRDEKRREHCKANNKSARCVAAKARLSEMVAAFIRDGGSVPAPAELE